MRVDVSGLWEKYFREEKTKLKCLLSNIKIANEKELKNHDKLFSLSLSLVKDHSPYHTGINNLDTKQMYKDNILGRTYKQIVLWWVELKKPKF